jgi:hypothetical protein
MKKTFLKSIAAIMFCSLVVMACSEKETSTRASGEQEPTPEYSFIPVEQWLPGTEWTVRRIYKKYGSCTGSWLQFRMAYDETQYGNAPGDNCRDTIAFEEGTYSVFGRANYSHEYSVADSVVILGFQRIYQISADSMIVYGWDDCNVTTDVIKAWLFTKVR